ncbi:hypothetical protein RhiirA1_447091 [Rhizophagus irregularis]|uniref:Uncharacterized protein n=1 Tax=Rhizophagus irregularis TaxID=588596 RepID=A0A2N0QTG9_9GLOM|nr:hypothetical protein RhiirA1_447091 [Rhizophagus irregularis]
MSSTNNKIISGSGNGVVDLSLEKKKESPALTERNCYTSFRSKDKISAKTSVLSLLPPLSLGFLLDFDFWDLGSFNESLVDLACFLALVEDFWFFFLRLTLPDCCTDFPGFLSGTFFAFCLVGAFFKVGFLSGTFLAFCLVGAFFKIYGMSYTIMSLTCSRSSSASLYPVSICVTPGADVFAPKNRVFFLFGVCASGFAVNDWCITCLFSAIRAFCLSFFQEVLGVTVRSTGVISTSGSIGGVTCTGFGVVFGVDMYVDPNLSLAEGYSDSESPISPNLV